MRLALRIVLVSIIAGGFLLPGCASSSFFELIETKTPSPAESFPAVTIETAGSKGLPPVGTELASTPTSAGSFTPLSVSAQNCDYGGVFKTIEAVDRYTVRFVLCAPEVAFLSKIAFPTFGIHPREWLERNVGDGVGSMLTYESIGTGPYKVREWTHGEKLVFEAFENYWGEEKARTPNLVFRWNLNGTDRLVELQAGTVDGIDNVNSDDFPTVLNDPDLILTPRSTLSVSYLGMNNTSPPFDNEKVRQAIAMAIDRRKIIDDDFPKGYEMASHFTPCVIPNGCTGDSWYEYDPVRARELLAEAGLPNGFRTELAYRDVVRGYLPWPGTVAEDIKDQLWENLNVAVKTRKLDEIDFYNMIDSGTYPGLYLLGWGADFPDITDFLDTHFGLDANGQLGGKFGDIVDALASGNAIPDNGARRPFYETANNAIKYHTPMIPISYGGWIFPDSLAVAYKRYVDGVHASPFGLEAFSSVSISGKDTFIWMQNAEPLSLYCAGATDIETWRACAQITESLYRFSVSGVDVEPGLAEFCQPSGDLTEWTCTLRKNVPFHDGSMLDANDVVVSFAVQWDASYPLHEEKTDAFIYFKEFWGGFINSPNP
jgi:peptide/nickel transport system substrate-binding protein